MDSRPPLKGDAARGREVFRFETFGNEGFWTDAVRVPQGFEAEKVTPLGLIELGLHIDSEKLPPALKADLVAQFGTNLSKGKAPLLHDPEVTGKLIAANAVVGFVAKDTDGDGVIDLKKGDKVGVSCAICHTIADGSVYEAYGRSDRGAVGRRLDGRATLSLDMGGNLANAANSRALYPNLQLELGGKTVGRAPKGIRPESSEAEVDVYLRNKDFYPRGTFDETNDGVGNPVQNVPLFRQDLAAPYGSIGLHETFEGISNASYTTNLDLTTLATPEGKAFLTAVGGTAGAELHANYVRVLKETGVTGYPFVNAPMGGKPGHRDTPTGRQTDPQKLADLKAYTFALAAPPGAKGPPEQFARGKAAFAAANCTQCHSPDTDAPVKPDIFPIAAVWPGYAPEVREARKPPLSPIQNAPGVFDDKVVVLDASERGERRGFALPLLLDLASKPAFLHDNSVPNLGTLLDPARGPAAPHPFYVADAQARADVATLLAANGPAAPPKAKDAPKD